MFCLHAIVNACIFFQTNTLGAQPMPVGAFDAHADLGNPLLKGTAVYNETEQEYLLSGSGANNAHQFQYLYKKIKGDFIIKATIKFRTEKTAFMRKGGIVAMEAPDTTSAYAALGVFDSIPLAAAVSFHTNENDSINHISISSYCPKEISLERSGNLFTFSVAAAGENYKTISNEIQLSNELCVGIYIRSNAGDKKEYATFSNVRLIIPAPKDFRPYIDYIGSHLEIMDIETGHRKIMYSVPDVSLQAPNWTRDNKFIIYNQEGKLYRYELDNGKISTLNTGNVKNMDGDHVLSFDGQMLGISGNMGEHETIYIMPADGSDNPLKITSGTTGPSYLHGWSPDKKSLVFTGRRNGIFDIWLVNTTTHTETQLTHNNVLDDGPEFTPDGKYIYFNSVRTGTMQIWRMKADGSNQEQVTFDEYNNWFPHISPDGKWIVYLAFPKNIDPSSHPFYKNIYIKLMPASGGVPKTIAYLYGGQGTMNVPSWSPDSKNIAFVSNSKF